MPRLIPTKSIPATLALALACVGSFALATSCASSKGYKGKPPSAALQWLDSPTKGSKDGNFIKIPSLGVTFEIPETRYVFKNCFEPSHSPEAPTGWTPVVRCSSSSDSGGGDDFDEGGEESSFGDDISLTFYLGRKERPIDERAVAFFKNEYQSQGMEVRELSYNDDYHDKAGIYAELVTSAGGGDTDGEYESETPTEIIQFMFPYQDVIFVARMEYPFGDTRSVTADWKAMMWYFKFEMPDG